MNKSVVFGSGILVVALVVGCGGSSDDAIMKEQIDLMNQMASVMEKVTDADSMKSAEAEIKTLKEKGDALNKKTKDWSEDKKKKMLEKYKGEIQSATERFGKAMIAAMMKGGKGGIPGLPGLPGAPDVPGVPGVPGVPKP
jgi:hypothetical protein